MMTHTPGPWEAKPTVGRIVLNGSSIYGVADITGEFARWNPDDLYLMAAAPDLLEAARIANQELLDLGQGSSASPALRALWRAIAKAEGRTNDQ